MTLRNEPLRRVLRRLALRLADLEDSGLSTRTALDALRTEAVANGTDPNVLTDLTLTAGLLLLGLDRVDALRSVWPDTALDDVAATCVQALDHLGPM